MGLNGFTGKENNSKHWVENLTVMHACKPFPHLPYLSLRPCTLLSTPCSHSLAFLTPLTRKGSPYIINGPISIEFNGEMRIDAGVEVRSGGEPLLNDLFSFERELGGFLHE